MKLTAKLNYLQEHHMGEWLRTREKVEDDLSYEQTFLCVCGRLATGLHEMNCRRFRNKVISETVKRLKHLLPSGKAVQS